MNNPKKSADGSEEFTFPDEDSGDKKPKNAASEEDELQIDIEDDTPEADRGREPMPKSVVDDLENDELEEYSDSVKQRIKQAKKVYHDERRRAERESREKQEAVKFAQRMMDENRQLKQQYSQGEQSYLEQQRDLAETRASVAEREWRDAYESGDTDKITEAQRKLSSAQYNLNSLGMQRSTPQQPANYQQQVPLQGQQNTVSNGAQQSQAPKPDTKTLAWQERNGWFGTDTEMTSAALGLHQKLLMDNGPEFAQTDDYFDAIDKTMRRRFPEYYDGEEMEAGGGKSPTNRAPQANVVAPATRSRSSKRIRLTKSQVELAGKLGLTPQQYAVEMMKLEG